MNIPYGRLLCAILFFLVVCLMLSEPVDGRRGGGSRGASGSRSSSRSRSRSRSRSTASKVAKKFKKALKKFKKKLPKSKVKLGKLTPLNRRMTRTEQAIIWTAVSWQANSRLRRASHYVHFRCRKTFAQCRTDVTTERTVNQASDGYGQVVDYCDFVTRRRVCLVPGVDGCSQREYHWLRVAACEANTTSVTVDWSETGPNSTTSWPVNQVIKLSVVSTGIACQSQFAHCRDLALARKDESGADSYCAMIQDHKDCLLTNGRCTTDDWSTFSDAACRRTAVNWQDGSIPPPSDSLRLTTAIVTPVCQLGLEKCRLDAVAQGQTKTYCALISDRKTCLTVGQTCTEEDWQALLVAACNSGVKAGVSSFWGVLLLVLVPVAKKAILF